MFLQLEFFQWKTLREQLFSLDLAKEDMSAGGVGQLVKHDVQ